MKPLLLFPGEFVCDRIRLKRDSDDRQILRMFVNTLVWGTVGVAVILMALR